MNCVAEISKFHPEMWWGVAENGNTQIKCKYSIYCK